KEVKGWKRRGAITALAFSPDGRLLASSGEDQTIVLQDVSTWQTVRTVKPGFDGADSVAFSPDGKLLVAAVSQSPGCDPGMQKVRIWDVASGELRQTISAHHRGIFTAAFSPDGKLVASGGFEDAPGLEATAGSIKLWDAATGRLRAVFAGDSQTRSLAFSPDGRLLATSAGEAVFLWNLVGVETLPFKDELAEPSFARRLVELKVHQEVKSVAFSPDGRLLYTGDTDGAVRVWEIIE
ncbi:WD40 repeat domain-containing protein, partial [Myxococcota bacterium]